MSVSSTHGPLLASGTVGVASPFWPSAVAVGPCFGSGPTSPRLSTPVPANAAQVMSMSGL